MSPESWVLTNFWTDFVICCFLVIFFYCLIRIDRILDIRVGDCTGVGLFFSPFFPFSYFELTSACIGSGSSGLIVGFGGAR